MKQGLGKLDPFGRRIVQASRVHEDPHEEEDGRRARRERIMLWLFLFAVLVISSLTAWLFWVKIRSP